MSRQRTPKVSHATDRQLAVGRSAVWSLFRPGETWLPYGYRAELGSAFLCADLGITPEVREDHAAYIASWLTVLKGDKRFIFTAASHAQRAADYLHSLQPAREQDPREAVLSAMDSEGGPLPDAVAAAWAA